jgi:hypothetical protein
MAYIDNDHVIVLRFIGSTQNRNPKLVFTQEQWRRFIGALPGLQVVLVYGDDHRTIKGNGLIVEYTFDLDRLRDPDLPRDVRVFERVYQAIVCDVCNDTPLRIPPNTNDAWNWVHSEHREGQPSPALPDESSELEDIDEWLRYLCHTGWTRNLLALLKGGKKMAAEMEETLCRDLLDDIRLTPAPDSPDLLHDEDEDEDAPVVPVLLDKLKSIREEYPQHIFDYVTHTALTNIAGSGFGTWVDFTSFRYDDYVDFLDALHVMASSVVLVGILDRAVEFVWFKDTKLETWPFDYPKLPNLVQMSTNRDWVPRLLGEWKKQLDLDEEGMHIGISKWETRSKYIALFQSWYDARPRRVGTIRPRSESSVPYERHPPPFPSV